MNTYRKRVLLALFVAWAGNSACVWATDLGFGVGYIGEYSDNFLNSSSSQQEEWTNIYLAGINFRETGEQLAANVAVQAEYRDYTRGTYQDETLGYINAAALWSILPNRLVWSVIDRLDELPQNATDPVSPLNRDAVNVLDTGPDIHIPLTPISAIILGARAGNVTFRESDDDYNRYSVALRWRHRLSQTSLFSVNIEGEKVIHSKTSSSMVTTTPDYVKENAYLEYDYRQTWSRILIDVGASQFVSEGEVEDTQEPLVRISLSRRMTSESAIGFSFGRELFDVGGALLADVADPSIEYVIAPAPSAPVELATGSVFNSRRGSGFYTYTGPEVSAQLSIYYRDLDYLITPDDRSEAGTRLRLTYYISASLMFGVDGSILRTEFHDISRLDRSINYGAFATYRVSPHLNIRLEGTHVDRNSSDPLGSYDVTRGIVSIYYSSHPHYSPVARR